ncbi:MAG: hypothetical protein Q8R12_05240 [bacterium]|nr:hypothetical protein [bacterium]
MKVPRHLVLKMETRRNSLLKKYRWFVALYCLYLKILDAREHKKEKREDIERFLDLMELASFKLSGLTELINRVFARLSKQRSYYRIPLLPNWLITKERTFRGKKFRMSDYSWHIFITKRENRGLWQDMDLHFGRLLDIAVRWDGGKRRYVGVRFWLTPRKFASGNGSDPHGKWEFYHEIWEIDNRFPVSRWWWGHGWFRATSRGGLSELYCRFGHLFCWTWNGHLHGFLGKELTAAEKQEVFETKYMPELKKWGKESAQMCLDAITGYPRNPEKEYYWACCMDCRVLMHPDTSYGTEEYLRCDKCRERHEKELDAKFVA